MSPTLLWGLAGFALVSSITPGPNNLMLMASGANFGLKRTLPHMAGVSLGFGLMVLLLGLGMAGLFAVAPWLYDVIRWGGAAYLVFLAYRIAVSSSVGQGKTGAKPMTFLQAAAFQWVNPKAWAMAVGAVAAYAPTDHLAANVALVAFIFMLVNAPSVSIWAAFGVGVRRWLDRPAALRAFNLTMATLLLLSLAPMLTSHAPAPAPAPVHSRSSKPS